MSETIIILVHPGSLCGSLITANEWHPRWRDYARRLRELLLTEFCFYAGTRIVVRGGLVDGEADTTEEVARAISQAEESHRADTGEELRRVVARISGKHQGVREFIVTGAWADPKDGCAYTVFDSVKGAVNGASRVKISRYAARKAVRPKDIEAQRQCLVTLGNRREKVGWHVARDEDALNHNNGHLQHWSAVDPRWRELGRRLLNIGGTVVCALPEEDMENLLAHGRTWVMPQAEIRLMKGDKSRCHQNTLYLKNANPSLHACTGWALSNDGIWRQHSWCVDEDWRVVETTSRRVAYHGFIMTGLLFRRRLAEAF